MHIFEPRYRRMVRECLDEKSPFGMLLALPNGVAHVGCTAEILEVTRRYDDGRMDILTVGRRPYRVVDLYDDDPLLQGAVDYLEDEDSCLEPGNQEQLVQLYEVCYTLLFSGMPGTSRSLRRNHYLLQLRAGFRSICCGSSKFWNYVPKRNVRTGWSGIFASGPCIYTR